MIGKKTRRAEDDFIGHPDSRYRGVGMGGMRATKGPRPATLAPARGSFSSLPSVALSASIPSRRQAMDRLRGPEPCAAVCGGAWPIQMHRLLHRPPRTLLGLKLKP